MAFVRFIEIQAGPEGGTGISVTKNFMKFDIKKSNKKTLNKATVQIYNLSDETMNQMKRRDNLLLIKAGYEDETISNIFVGSVVHSTIANEETDRILEIEAHDGQRNLMTKTISLGFSAGASVTTILNNIFSVLAYPVVGREKIPPGIVYNQGYNFVGYARKALEEVLEKVDLRYSIQNEQIYIYTDEDEVVQNTGLLLSPKTGLLYIESLEERRRGTAAKSTQQKAQYKAISLLFPQLIPGARIQIKSGSIDGFFVIESSTLVGDNQDGDFTAEIEVKAI